MGGRRRRGPGERRGEKEAGDRRGEGVTLGNLGIVYRQQGRWEEAIEMYQQVLAIFRALGDRHGEGVTLMSLGVVYGQQGRWEEAIEVARRTEQGLGHTAVIYSTNIEHMHRMARTMNTCIFVKNAPSYAGLGYGGEGYTSFTIAHPTGEGLTNARHFTRDRRCTLKDYFRII